MLLIMLLLTAAFVLAIVASALFIWFMFYMRGTGQAWYHVLALTFGFVISTLGAIAGLVFAIKLMVA